MNKNSQYNWQETGQLARLQAWAMSLICAFLALFAVAAAMRIPHYLGTSDHLRLIGVILFGLLALVGVVDNIHSHVSLWRLRKKMKPPNSEFNINLK